MALNCKPGDLAIIVSVPRSTSPRIVAAIEAKALGRIVRCLTLARSNDGLSACWRITEPFSVLTPVGAIDFFGIADKDLRPIRDPGDDAVDEVLAKLGAPTALAGVPAEEV